MTQTLSHKMWRTLRPNQRLLLVLLMVLAVVLVACGGDDGGDDAPVEDAPAADSENLPPGINPAGEGDTPALPPALANPGGGPPGGGSAQDLPFVNPGSVPADIVEDFSTLTVGDSVTLVGDAVLLPEEDANGNPITILVDANGAEVRYQGLPLDIASSMDGQRWLLGGTVEAAGDDGRLVLISTANDLEPFVESANPPGSGLPFDPNTSGAPGNRPPAGPPGVGSVPGLPGSNLVNMDVVVAPGLTALGAYDALIAALGDDLSAAQLTSISGSAVNGWNIRFNLPDDLTTTYVIGVDGMVRNAPPAPAVDLPGMTNFPIDRALVVLDSDVAAVQLVEGEADLPPLQGMIELELLGMEGGGVQWQARNVPVDPLDATTAP